MCVRIGRLKKASGIEIYQPDREKEVLQARAGGRDEGPLGPEAIGRLFERIIDEARRLERRVVHGEMDRRAETDRTELKSEGLKSEVETAELRAES